MYRRQIAQAVLLLLSLWGCASQDAGVLPEGAESPAPPIGYIVLCQEHPEHPVCPPQTSPTASTPD